MANNYKNEFTEVRPLGSGGFSTVFEAKSNSDGLNYAVKKIPFVNNDEIRIKTLKEVDFMRKLQSNNVISFIDSWTENNYYLTDKNDEIIDRKSLLFDNDRTLLLHIQMELCNVSLETFIQLISDKNKNSITLENYSIVCEIFIQLLESIQYLHQHNPPIIHRDIKPANIMLTNQESGRKVKLTDFGLSTYHEFVEQSKSKYVGTKSYRAPELDDKHYDTKADIYSLGVVMKQLFNIDHNKEDNHIDRIIETKYTNAREVCLKCVSALARLRPDCDQLMRDKKLWFYNIDENRDINSRKGSYKKLINEFNIFERRYRNEFKEYKMVNETGFAMLFEAFNLNDKKTYSIKKIPFGNGNRVRVLREINILRKLNPDYVVSCIDSWIENNYYHNDEIGNNLNPRSPMFYQENTLLMHIQMEYNTTILKEFIKKRGDSFPNTISQQNYGIACQILMKILECVKYLHESKPSIIHRDLKPQNIVLIQEFDGFNVKLSDFDLSTYHEFFEKSHTKYVGTKYYRAPEVNDRHYDTKVDIYSLGKIMQELFNIDLNR